MKDPNPDGLRSKAEHELKRRSSTGEVPRTEEELRRLLHELQVHQIELELQCEELWSAKDALEDSNRRYVDLYDFAPVSYFTLGSEGEICQSNLRGATLLGRPRSDLGGQNFKSFIKEDERAAFASFIESIDNQTEKRNWEGTLVAAGGEVRKVRIEAVFSESIGGRLFAATDITEMKAMEEQRLMLEERLQQAQKMEALGTLAGGIAHDFNNLLNIILGYTNLLIDSLPASGEQREDLGKVVAASMRASELVKQILSVGKKSGRKVITFDLSNVVWETLNLLEPFVPVNVRIESDVSRKPSLAIADPTEMHQVVMNLCTNAIHAMQPQGGTLTVRLGQSLVAEDGAEAVQGLPAGEYNVLEVEDTGSGMDEATLGRIFEPYFTTKPMGTGTGLGLAVVQSVVAQSGGAITAQSVQGRGSVFTVYIPCLTAVPLKTSQFVQEKPVRGSGNVLFVDDEPYMAKLGRKMLESVGYAVTETSSSMEAFTIFESDPSRFDIVVTDQTMPEMSGTELLRKIMALRPDMPTIICTGYSDFIDEEKAVAQGIHGYVEKPYGRNTLAKIVAEVIAAGKES